MFEAASQIDWDRFQSISTVFSVAHALLVWLVHTALFSGQTLACAFTGRPLFPQYRDAKLLRGDANFAVSIPKVGNGAIEGDLENFEEWTGSRWRFFTSGFSIDLQSATISDDGTFFGTAIQSFTARSVDFPSILSPSHSLCGASGGIARDSQVDRKFKGSFLRSP